jgi:hypothetical protein
MINNQKITRVFATPLRKGLAIGATSVVAATGLLGVGVASANAATAPSASLAVHSSASVHSHLGARSLIKQLRADLFKGQISGSKAQALASRIVDNPAIFSALPANLQSDLTALKSAPTASATTLAQQIKSTVLSGGYGTQLQNLATALQASVGHSIGQDLITEIRGDVAAILATGVTTPGSSTTSQPTTTGSDVTGLQNAPSTSDLVHLFGSDGVAGSNSQLVQSLNGPLASLTGGIGK